MRILHVLDHSIPLHSGYAFRTLAIMREQRKLGWEPILLTGTKQGNRSVLEEEAEGWHFFRTPAVTGSVMKWPVARELAQMRALEGRLQQIVRSEKPAIIHAHSPVLNGLPALRVARRLDLPLVYEVRAFWEDAAVEHGTSQQGSARYRATRAAETFVLRRADAVTTICDGLRQAIVERNVDARRVSVVANAVDVEQFTVDPPVDEALRHQLGLDGCFVLGFAGSFYSYEGLDLLISALPLMRDWRRPVKVLLVGGGPEEARLKVLAKELEVEDQLCFTGRVPQTAVSRYYALVDLLVYPRVRQRLTELVTPLKPLEAMAQGKLVAASDVGGHRELIRDGETGFLFAPESSESLADCILKILETASGLLEKIRQAGRRYVETERNWSMSVSRYKDVYASVTSGEASDTARAD